MQGFARSLDCYVMTGNGVHRRRSLTAVAAVVLTTMFAATTGASAATAGGGNGATAPSVTRAAVGTADASVSLAQLNVVLPTRGAIKTTLGTLDAVADTTLPTAVSFLELVGAEAADQRAIAWKRDAKSLDNTGRKDGVPDVKAGDSKAAMQLGGWNAETDRARTVAQLDLLSGELESHRIGLQGSLGERGIVSEITPQGAHSRSDVTLEGFHIDLGALLPADMVALPFGMTFGISDQVELPLPEEVADEVSRFRSVLDQMQVVESALEASDAAKARLDERQAQAPELAALLTERDLAQEALAAALDDLDGASAAVQDAEDALAEASAAIAPAQALVEAAEADLARAESELDAAAEAAAEVRADVDAAEADVEDAEAAVAAIEDDIAQAEADIQALRDEIDVIEAEIDVLLAAAAADPLAAPAILADVAAKLVAVDEREADIDGLQADIAALQEDLVDGDAEVQAAQDALDAAEAVYAPYAEDVATAEAAEDAAEDALDEAQDDLEDAEAEEISAEAALDAAGRALGATEDAASAARDRFAAAELAYDAAAEAAAELDPEIALLHDSAVAMKARLAATFLQLKARLSAMPDLLRMQEKLLDALEAVPVFAIGSLRIVGDAQANAGGATAVSECVLSAVEVLGRPQPITTCAELAAAREDIEAQITEFLSLIAGNQVHGVSVEGPVALLDEQDTADADGFIRAAVHTTPLRVVVPKISVGMAWDETHARLGELVDTLLHERPELHAMPEFSDDPAAPLGEVEVQGMGMAAPGRVRAMGGGTWRIADDGDPLVNELEELEGQNEAMPAGDDLDAETVGVDAELGGADNNANFRPASNGPGGCVGCGGGEGDEDGVGDEDDARSDEARVGDTLPDGGATTSGPGAGNGNGGNGTGPDAGQGTGSGTDAALTGSELPQPGAELPHTGSEAAAGLAGLLLLGLGGVLRRRR